MSINGLLSICFSIDILSDWFVIPKGSQGPEFINGLRVPPRG